MNPYYTKSLVQFLVEIGSQRGAEKCSRKPGQNWTSAAQILDCSEQPLVEQHDCRVSYNSGNLDTELDESVYRAQ
eukprot:766847-Hanusia_phi.AAC.2